MLTGRELELEVMQGPEPRRCDMGCGCPQGHLNHCIIGPPPISRFYTCFIYCLLYLCHLYAIWEPFHHLINSRDPGSFSFLVLGGRAARELVLSLSG